MKKSKLDVKLTVATGILIFVLLLFICSAENLKDLFALASKAVASTYLLRLVYIKWIWKLKPFTFFHDVPVLEGLWKGEYQSTGNPNTPADRLTGDAELEIFQPDIHSIQIARTSKESKSLSFGETFFKDVHNQTRVTYSYLSETNLNVRQQSPISYGSAILTPNKSGNSLKGQYWTDVKTTGDLTFVKKSKKRK